MPIGTPGNDSSIGESRHPPPSQARWRSAAASPGDVLELGREIAVDLKAEADFDEDRCRPSHVCFLFFLRPLTGTLRRPQLYGRGLSPQAIRPIAFIYGLGLVPRTRSSHTNAASPIA